jgi:AraC-like DNA-binding protein
MKSQIPTEWKTLAKTHRRDKVVPLHQHSTGQLLFAIQGVMLVETAVARWTIPPQRALWIPACQAHSIRFLSDTDMRTVYYSPQLIEQCAEFTRHDEVHVVVASTLIRELVLGLFNQQFTHSTHSLMAGLLLHTLRYTPSLPTYLPMPSNDKLRQVLTQILARNQWHTPMHQMASDALMSERTLNRHLTAELGMSYRTWKQRARIIASLDMLSSGCTIKAIARTMQFASAAAYIASFREILGCAPNTFRHQDGNLE